MNLDVIRSAAADLADAIHQSVAALREAFPEEEYYAVSLVVTDDFETIDLYANSIAHLEESGGGLLQKWYWGEWQSEAVPLEVDLQAELGEIDDFDEEPANGNAIRWFGAMTEALNIARKGETFRWHDREATLFCSMLDNTAAIWLEDLSARFLNPSEVYERVAAEIAASSREWYVDAEVDADDPKRMAYQSLLELLENR